jgi:hypothetical protein
MSRLTSTECKFINSSNNKVEYYAGFGVADYNSALLRYFDLFNSSRKDFFFYLRSADNSLLDFSNFVSHDEYVRYVVYVEGNSVVNVANCYFVGYNASALFFATKYSTMTVTDCFVRDPPSTIADGGVTLANIFSDEFTLFPIPYYCRTTKSPTIEESRHTRLQPPKRRPRHPKMFG